MEKKVRIYIQNTNQIVLASHGQSIIEGLKKARVEIGNSCGGHATCGTCQIRIIKGLEKLPERNELESEMAKDRGFAPEERLSCQVVIPEIDEFTIEIP